MLTLQKQWEMAVLLVQVIQVILGQTLKMEDIQIQIDHTIISALTSHFHQEAYRH
uniref:Uncharacterized protein n=1 Tax=Medicago truncatula TaxID=3880 RepID=I3T907_MEDTR|nr:unknown [Medicago truncatula]